MKFLFKLVFYLIVLAALVVGALWITRTSVLSSYLTNILLAQTQIEEIDLSTNQMTISGLTIMNSQGSVIQKAFAVDTIRITYQPANLLNDQIIIDEIAIENPYLGIEIYDMSGKDNNWSRMLQRLQPDDETTSPSKKGEQAAPSKEILIKHLIITNTRVEASHKLTGKDTIHPNPIAKIELNNVGNKDEDAVGELISIIARTILEEVRKSSGLENIMQNVKAAPKNVLKTIQKSGEQVLDTLKGVFNKPKDDSHTPPGM